MDIPWTKEELMKANKKLLEKVDELGRLVEKERNTIDWLVKRMEENMMTYDFQQFVKYGKNNSTNIVNGMPWSFNFLGYPVTHENDECYLISTTEGIKRFTPQDVIVITTDSMIKVITKSK